MKARIWVAVFGVAAGACAPLTFSEPASIDFETYRAVRVELVSGYFGVDYARDYLVMGLREQSGFSSVTTDPAASVDLILSVEVSVNPTTDTEGDTEFEGTARFTATTPSGQVVDRGTESDTSDSDTEVVEDVLDEITLHYFHPYRL